MNAIEKQELDLVIDRFNEMYLSRDQLLRQLEELCDRIKADYSALKYDDYVVILMSYQRAKTLLQQERGDERCATKNPVTASHAENTGVVSSAAEETKAADFTCDKKSTKPPEEAAFEEVIRVEGFEPINKESFKRGWHAALNFVKGEGR